MAMSLNAREVCEPAPTRPQAPALVLGLSGNVLSRCEVHASTTVMRIRGRYEHLATECESVTALIP